MKIENIEVYGFKASLRAMRNPKDSWHLSDSYVSQESDEVLKNFIIEKKYEENVEKFVLGDKDIILSQTLSKAGTEHCKHLRFIQVWFDLTLPRFMWQEWDTYKFAERLSCSTMHKLTSKELTTGDFEYGIKKHALADLNELIRMSVDKNASKYKRKMAFLQLKNDLPEGFLQKRTITTNYQEALNIHYQREHHPLPQWQAIDDMILRLPYFIKLTGVV